MENYKRFLTYINSYTRGELIRNVGASKIELRGDACRITVNAKGLMNIGVENVFLFRRDKNEMEITYLGKLAYSNGNYELRVETDRNNMIETGVGFDDFSGVILLKDKNMEIIEKPQQLYAGIWDNKPLGDLIRKTPKLGSSIRESTAFNSEATGSTKTWENNIMNSEATESVEVWEDTTLNSESAESPIVIKNPILDSYVEDINSKEEEVMNTIVEQEFVKLENVVERINSRNTDEHIVGNRVIHKYEELSELAASNINEEYSNCNEDKLDCLEVRIAKAEEMRKKFKINPSSAKKVSVVEQNIIKILEEYPRMDSFDDKSECVRVEPEDIVDMPVNIWMLANNIFLKECYSKFKHLTIVKCCNNYFVGVPGIRCEKEQFKAYLHGFSEFKTIRKIENITDDYGYWLVKINI